MADDGSISGAFTGEGDDGGAGHHSKIKKLMQPLPGLAEAAPATDINATAKLIFLSTLCFPKALDWKTVTMLSGAVANRQHPLEIEKGLTLRNTLCHIRLNHHSCH